MRAVARLVECDHGGCRADVVVDDLDFGVALLERCEFGGPVRPRRTGVEAHDHAFLLRGFVERFLAGIELAGVEDGLRREAGGEEGCDQCRSGAA